MIAYMTRESEKKSCGRWHGAAERMHSVAPSAETESRFRSLIVREDPWGRQHDWMDGIRGMEWELRACTC